MKKLISHRGNINGKDISLENNPSYIDTAIKQGYDVEIDFWYVNNQLYLGHDTFQYGINLSWLVERKTSLWIHCKNLPSVEYLHGTDFNYFWHENDKLTLTSKGYIWAFPGQQPIYNSIAVLPEIHGDKLGVCQGVCSDFIKTYRDIQLKIINSKV